MKRHTARFFRFGAGVSISKQKVGDWRPGFHRDAVESPAMFNLLWW